MTERPSNPLERLKWFLGWDSTPDEDLPDPHAAQYAALSKPHQVWEGEGMYTGSLPVRFQELDRLGYDLMLVVPGQVDFEKPLTEWEHADARKQSVTLETLAFDNVSVAKIPAEMGLAQAFDLLGWVAFHPANNLSVHDVRLFAIHRDSAQSFVAFPEPKSSYVIGRFRNHQAFCAHVPGVWRFRSMVVEQQDAPTRPGYQESLEAWGLHEMKLLASSWSAQVIELAVVPVKVVLGLGEG